MNVIGLLAIDYLSGDSIDIAVGLIATMILACLFADNISFSKSLQGWPHFRDFSPTTLLQPERPLSTKLGNLSFRKCIINSALQDWAKYERIQ